MFDIAFSELILIGLVALVVLGPRRLQETARQVACLDVYVGLATVAKDHNYCQPVVDDSRALTIRNASSTSACRSR